MCEWRLEPHIKCFGPWGHFRNLLASFENSDTVLPHFRLERPSIMTELYLNAISFLAGITSHIFYFNRGEHHMYGVRYLQAFLSISIASIFYLSKAQDQTLRGATTTVAALSASFLTGLYTSLLIYRAFLSPLCKFPGPFGARLTNFWLSARIGTSSHALFKIQDLHKKYGPIVRIGSNDLAIADANFVQPIYGMAAKCTKSPWYDADYPLISLQTTRVKAIHNKRRQVWIPAFSDKALRGYEKRIEPFAALLLERIRSFEERPVDVSVSYSRVKFEYAKSMPANSSKIALVPLLQL